MNIIFDSGGSAGQSFEKKQKRLSSQNQIVAGPSVQPRGREHDQ
jgi:hypothetical protein